MISFRKKLVFSAIMVSLTIFIPLLSYLIYVYKSSQPLYKSIKNNERGWRGKPHEYNPILGFSPIAGAAGAEIMPGGSDIPMQFSEAGFRIPVGEEKAKPYKRPLILALGCSFTYGAAVPAEDTYPYLVGKELQGTELNAGVCGYGLSQMLLLAKELIPQYLPDYLMVQYSNWLVERAISGYAPSYYGRYPTPFFIRQSTQSLGIYPPYYPSIADDLPIDNYRDAKTSLVDKFSFFFTVSLPLYTHDIYYEAVTRAKKTAGLIPVAVSNREEVVRFVYNEIAGLSKIYNSEMIIVALRAPNKDHLNILKNIPNTIVVETELTLFSHLKEKTEQAYKRQYYHWRNNEIIDSHPNAEAHRIIAKTIVQNIKKISDSSPLNCDEVSW